MARPVEVPWTCHKTGDCCRELKGITVTAQEKTLLVDRVGFATRFPVFQPHDSGKMIRNTETGAYTPQFYVLLASPCPFLSTQGLCTVHDVRPYNCRRFICGRTDTTRESFESGGPMGCHNLSDRLSTSLRFQEFYDAQQRRAQKDWALSHGWSRT